MPKARADAYRAVVGSSQAPEIESATTGRDQSLSISEQSRLYHEAAPKALEDSESSLSLVIAEVGHDQRVLELGTSTGYMSRALTERGCAVVGVELDRGAAELAGAYCERMLVGDLDDPSLLGGLGADRFDVIVAADVLEHLRDPLSALKRALGYLRDDGRVVASLPNVTHVSVRIALLQGRFPYGPTGLLDHTHLQFYDRKRVLDTFEQAGLVVVRVIPRHLSADASPVPFERNAVAGQALKLAESDPDAEVYQFIVVAYPPGHPALAKVTSPSELVVEAAHGEAELRSLLLSAHEQLGERDAALEQQRQELLDADRRSADDRSARICFETESQLAHQKVHELEQLVSTLTASRAWRAAVLLRRLKNRLMGP